jgi:pantoate--beta-alanine ligase
MKIVEQASALRQLVAEFKVQGLSCGFVPTMGNLHAGHLALVETAAQQCDRVVVSIFVNPLQFGPAEDLDNYPNTPLEDEQALSDHGVAILYRPALEDVYPAGLEKQTRILVPGLSDTLCGQSRPGHFSGVATVVNRLFNQVQPDLAFFGKKDYQQYLVIQKMVNDLAMNLHVVGVATIRMDSGLAMSSRNNYLSQAELKQAAGLYRVMQEVVKNYQQSPEIGNEIVEQGLSELKKQGFKPDYLSVRRQSDLMDPGPADENLILVAAAWLGSTRLIDNLEFAV